MSRHRKERRTISVFHAERSKGHTVMHSSQTTAGQVSVPKSHRLSKPSWNLDYYVNLPTSISSTARLYLLPLRDDVQERVDG